MEAAMYERMLNKKEVPTIAVMTAYCGENGGVFTSLNEWLSRTFGTEQKIVWQPVRLGNRSQAETETDVQYLR